MRIPLPTALPTVIAVLGVLGGLAVAPLAAQQRAAHGIVRFDAPAGWSRNLQPAGLVLASPDGAAQITIGNSRPLAGAVADELATELARVGQLPGFKLEAQQDGGKHTKSQGQWCGAVCSYESKARPGTYDYEWLTVLGGGGRCVVFATVFAGRDAYDRLGGEPSRLINDAQLTTMMVVERGRPNLTRFAIDECVDFLEWLMQSPFLDDQRATVEAEVRGIWKSRDKDEIQGIVDLLEARQELAKLDAAERDLVRASVFDELLAECRKEPEDPLARMLLAIHATASQPIAEGEPALTRHAADAFTEYLFFAASRLADHDVQPDKDVKAKFAAHVAEGYAGLAADERALIAGMTLTWPALRVAWPTLPQEQRQALLAGWRQSGPIAGMAQQFAAAKQAAAERAAAEQAARQRPVASSGQAPTARSLAEQQALMQAQQASWQMMQRVMQGNNDTLRIMASNMGGNTTYRYRW